jgi:hypothetical protein
MQTKSLLLSLLAAVSASALVWTIRDFSFLFQYQTTPDALTGSF